jgi:long-chain acyl-CoA synthetase
VQRDDHLVVVGENRPRLYAAMLAAQALGAVPVPMYQDAAAPEYVFPINNADIAMPSSKTRNRSTSCWNCANSAPLLKRIWFDDPRGLRNYDEPGLDSLDALLAAGQAHDKAHPDFFDAEVARGQPQDVAAMFFTSGTTGNPKGVVHTHFTLLDRALPARALTSSRRPKKCWPTCRWPGSARTSSAMRSGWPAATW